MTPWQILLRLGICCRKRLQKRGPVLPRVAAQAAPRRARNTLCLNATARGVQPYEDIRMLEPRLRMVFLACVLATASGVAPAQDFPSRTIKIIVPNPPGGAGDIGARLVATKLSDVFRQPVVVENQPGASGAIGMTMLKRAAPDGHTIGVVISLSQTVDRVQNKTASFDIAKDF